MLSLMIFSLYIIYFISALIKAEIAPVGGANCTQNTDCGGANGGKCINNTCNCPPQLANVSCSYKRYNANLPGALNIALCFIGVGGVGNFIIGNTGRAVAQLILMLTVYIILIPIGFMWCGFACCFGGKLATLGGTLTGIIVFLAILAGLGGFIWSIIDGANMLEGNLNDGNGFALFIPK